MTIHILHILLQIVIILVALGIAIWGLFHFGWSSITTFLRRVWTREDSHSGATSVVPHAP
jgi:hypothetical protein